jgi:hypothetical protein
MFPLKKMKTSVTIKVTQSKHIGVKLPVDCAEIDRLCKNKKFDQLFDLLLNMYQSTKTSSKDTNSEVGNKLNPRSNHSDTTCTTTANDQSETFIHPLMGGSALSCSFLHGILAYQPPFEVVDLICQLLNNERNGVRNVSGTRNLLLVVEETSDLSGRIPLHVAIQNYCDKNVVARLMHQTNARFNLCLSLDAMGRTPLHWAVSVSKSFTARAASHGPRSFLFVLSWIMKHFNNTKCVDNMFQIIQMLLKNCPRATVMKDVEGNRPIDIARQRQVDPAIVIALLETETLLGYEQLENLQTQFFSAVDKRVNTEKLKVVKGTEKPMKNFLDAVIECSFDDEMSLMSCDDISHPKVFVSEHVSI